MEKCLFGRFELHLPELLLEDEDVFMEVVNPINWQNSVSDSDKRHLMNLLPQYEKNETPERQLALKKLFAGENFKFGNPLHKFHRKLREGQFSPDVAKYSNMIKKVKEKDYQKRMKLYYSDLLKEILVNRQRVVDLMRSIPPGEPVKIRWWTNQPQQKLNLSQCVELRACRKYRKVIQEINEDFGNADTSSEEEDLYSELSRNPLYSSYLLDAGDITPSVMGTTDGKPLMSNGAGQPRKRAVSPVRMTEADMKVMIKRHKRKREEEPEDPELDTSGLSIEDVITRAYGKNFPKQVIKDRAPPQKKKSEKKSAAKKQKLSGSTPALWSHDLDLQQEGSAADSGGEDESGQYPVSSREYGEHGSYLSVLRDLIKEEPEQKLTCSKLELKVSDWQKTQCARQNPWFPDCNNWSSAAPSALKFLAGDLIGITLAFVPFVDYKERPQTWKWIGEGRDTEEELSYLYSHWLTHKEEQDLENKDASQTPPPRAYTDYIIKTPLDEDKEVFQEQETLRFDNPHQSFTYYMHGYESVVGPVKGVYLKPDANVKGRDHILLRKERPSYVTILTLVRDAAARLPNGEGTRADICELLKYSQYLAPAVTDSQINQVVSGALDRLHYEKDPCVKYDNPRKMWIYLHRNRSEDEFDKIHQAHGAAAKAKKALTKGKTKTILGKKSKDPPSTLHMVEQPGGGFAPVSLNPGGSGGGGGGLSLLPMPLQSPSSDNLEQTQTELMQSPKLAAPSQSPRHPSPSASPRAARAQPAASSSSSSSMSGLDILSSVAHDKLVGIKPVSAGHSQSHQALSGKVITQVSHSQIQQQQQKRLVVSKQQGGISIIGSPEHKTSKIIVTSPGQIPAGAKVIQTGTKPVAFSLLQSQNISKILEANTKGQGQQMKQVSVAGLPNPKTVVFASKAGAQGPTQQLLASLKQGPEKVGAGISLQQDGDASLSPAPVITSPATPDNKPVLARLISQSGAPQVITLSGGQKVMSSAVRMPQPASTIQTGSIQTTTKPNKPLILQRASSMDSSKGANSPAHTPGTSPQQVTHIVQPGTGNPTTIVLSKPGTPPSGKAGVTTISGASIPQKLPASGLQAAFGGKPVIIGGQQVHISGKPIHIGGKPVHISGKPVQIGGKPVQISGKPIQIGGKPVQIGGKPVQIGGKPIQIGGKTIQIGGKPINLGGQAVQIGGKPVQLIQGQGVTVPSAAISTQGSVVITNTPAGSKPATPGTVVQTVSSSLVNQLLQGGTIRTTSPAQVRVQGQTTTQAIRVQGGQIVSGSPHIRVQTPTGAPTTQQIRIHGTTATSGGMQQIRVQGQPMVQQVKVQGQSAAGQQLRIQGSNSVITLPKTGSSVGPGTPRVVTLTQGSLAGQQVVLQSPQNAQAKIVTASPQPHHQILTSGVGGKPTILTSSGGKPMQNIQLVRTVVSQAGGGKSGTTILLAQQPGQSGASTVVPPQVGQLAPGSLQTVVSQSGVARGKPAPVFARLVAPQGVRYTTVTSQQGHLLQGQRPQGVTVVQTPKQTPDTK